MAAWRFGAWGLVVATTACLAIAQDKPASGSRTWKAAAGKFEVEATFVDQIATTVRLKKADGQILSVPIERLSDEDKQFLAAQIAAKPPLATSFPKASEAKIAPSGTELAEKGPLATWQQGEVPFGLTPDPWTQTKPLPEGGFPVSKVDPYDKIQPPMILDAESGLVAFSIGRIMAGKPEETRGRIYLGKLPKGPAQLVWDVPESLKLWDYHAASDRALVMTGVDTILHGGEMLVLEGLSKGTPKELYRRKLPGAAKRTGSDVINWCAFADAEHVAAVYNNEFRIWNLATGEVVYGLAREHSSRQPRLSPGRRYLAMPLSGGVGLLNLVDGTPLGFVPCGGLLTPDVAFHPDGQRIAVTAANELVVHDIQSDLVQQVTDGIEWLNKSMPALMGDPQYALLNAKRVCEMIIDVVAACELLQQAAVVEEKAVLATSFIHRRMLAVEMNARRIAAGDAARIKRYDRILELES